MNYDLIDYVYITRKKLTKKRFLHTIGVVKTARDLAKIYNANMKKVVLAALLHDISKYENINKMKNTCKKFFSDELSDKDLENSEILHGFYAVYWLETKLNIKDKIILDAIKYHTIGHKDMNLEAKIVYIADAIEPSRNYPFVDKLRIYAKRNLDYAILMEIEHKIEYLKIKNLSLNKNTLELLEKLRNISF